VVQVPKGGGRVKSRPVPWHHARRCCIAKIRQSYCLRRRVGSWAKNEAGSPKLGASTLAKNLTLWKCGSARSRLLRSPNPEETKRIFCFLPFFLLSVPFCCFLLSKKRFQETTSSLCLYSPKKRFQETTRFIMFVGAS
jgi:hypothetical protein